MLDEKMQSRVDELEAENARLRSIIKSEWPDLDADEEIDAESARIFQAEFEEFSKRYLERKKDSERLDWIERNAAKDRGMRLAIDRAMAAEAER
jgi:hypothetical protein